MLEQDPRVTEGPTFFQSLYGWMKRVAIEVNAKAPLNSPTFTGDPKAPTPLSTDNDTSIATTAWAKLGFAFLFASPGYIKFPDWLGGWIVEWGISVSGAGGDTSVSFPLAFPNNVFPVLCTPTNGGGSTPNFASVGVTSTTAFNFSVWNTSAGRVASACKWVAMGN